ncbi:MAG: SLC13 family permease [Methylococcaceae bacterium]
MIEDLNMNQLSFIVILVFAFGLLVTERIRNDIVAMLIVLALAVTDVLSPSEALSGFSSEPAIIVASIFVISGAFHQTGLAERIGVWIGRLAGSSYSRILAVVMTSVALLSAFNHHVTTTAVMLPVTLDLSRERNIPASKLLMPLSFAASLGTTITIITAPAFLVASDALQRTGHPALGIFSIAPIGLSLSVTGILFMLLIGRFLLPVREGAEEPAKRFRLDNYFTEIKILPDSPFVGKTMDEITADGHYHFTVVGWIRSGRKLHGVFGPRQLKEGDVLLVNTTPEDVVAFREERGIELHPFAQYGVDNAESGGGEEKDVTEQLVQAIVAPASEIIGNSIRDIDFLWRYGAIVVGLWRREAFLRQELASIRLEAGDVLVLLGDEESLSRVAQDRAFLMVVPFHGELQLRRKASLAAGIMLATIVVAAFKIIHLEIVMLAGAMAMVLSGCITARQAYRAIDARIYVFIAGAIPLGAAMQKSGTAGLLAHWLQNVMGGWSTMPILLTIFAIVAVVTQFLSDAATTALFAPVAVVLAQSMGHAPEAYVITVAMASVTACLTPIGHHGNLLVYGVGRYRFADFLRVGTPMTILAALVVTLLAPLVWPE